MATTTATTTTTTSAEDENEEATQYLKLVRTILEHGEMRYDRTGVGTRAVFGDRLSFSLENGTIPLLTTKRVFWRGVVQELLWFIRGGTCTKPLVDAGVTIWDANGSREALDANGLEDYKPGELGPIYGWQWRHWGCDAWRADARCPHAPIEYPLPTGDTLPSPPTESTEPIKPGVPAPCGGIDQLAELLHNLRHHPWSRRHVLSAWNVADLKKMALPPCHVMCQFFVSASDTTAIEKGEMPKPTHLTCQLYMRSCDVGLGLPFNIASYALFTHMIARHCGLEAKRLIIATGDTHIYNNHVEALREQVTRQPLGFPKLAWVTPPTTTATENDDNTTFDLLRVTSDQFALKGYRTHPALSMEMAV